MPKQNRSGVHIADQIADAAVETITAHNVSDPLFMHIAFCEGSVFACGKGARVALGVPPGRAPWSCADAPTNLFFSNPRPGCT